MTEPTPTTSAAQPGINIPPATTSGSGQVAAAVGKISPTQTRHPWRTTARTVIQAGVAIAAGLPVLYAAASQHNTAEATGGVAVVLGVAAAVTRVMASPTVDRWLTALNIGAAPKS
jgi:hypothetical protein